HAVHARPLEEQRRNRHDASACPHHDEMQLGVRAETLPPGAQPVVTQEWMADLRAVDDVVPFGLERPEDTFIGDRLDGEAVRDGRVRCDCRCRGYLHANSLLASVDTCV